MLEKYIEAGRVVGTHGVRGEIRVEPWTDSAEFLRRFKTLYIDGRPIKVLSSRVHGALLLVKLEGFESVNDAMLLKGAVLRFDREDAALPEGACFQADLVGARVLTEDGAELGTLEEIFETPSSFVYIVRGETEHMIPAVPEFIMSTDAEAGLVTVRLIEGM